jgi:hypothetical protein
MLGRELWQFLIKLRLARLPARLPVFLVKIGLASICTPTPESSVYTTCNAPARWIMGWRAGQDVFLTLGILQMAAMPLRKCRFVG